MNDTSGSPGFRESSRTPLRAEVRLELSGGEELTGYTSDLSEGGMFVPVRLPRPVGTLWRLTLRLPDVEGEVTGFGEVVWIRVRHEGGERVPGMGIQFRHLDEPGPALVARQLARLEVASPRPEVEAQAVAQRGRDAAPAEPTPETEELVEEAPRGEAPVEVAMPAGELPPAPGRNGALPAGANPDPPTRPRGERELPLPPELGSFLDPPASVLPAAVAVPPPGPAQPPEPAAAATRRRPSWRLPALSGALLALGLAAFAMREPVVGWLVGGGGELPAPLTERSAAAEKTFEEVPAPAGADGPGPVPVAADAPANPQPSPGVDAPASALPILASAPAAAPPAAAAALSEVREISWWGVDGETIVVIEGDSPIPEERVFHQRLAGDPPRELVRIAGIVRPYRQGEIVVGTPEVLRIRTGHHPEAGEGELYVVLDLASPSAVVARVEAVTGGEVRLYVRSGG